MKRLGELTARTDTFDPLPGQPDETIDLRPEIFQRVWDEAATMRKNGSLLDSVRRIACPVIALHGTYDPHPYQGVMEPLPRIVPDFRCVVLPQCGHTPWKERFAKDAFYTALRAAMHIRP